MPVAAQVLALSAAAIFLAIGVPALVRPKRFVALFRDGSLGEEYNPFRDWIGTPGHLIAVRVIGAASLAMALFLIGAVVANCLGFFRS